MRQRARNRYPLIIIGAGPSGMAAATTAVKRGISTLIINEHASIGGQYLSCLPTKSTTISRRMRSRMRRQLEQCILDAGDLIKIKCGTCVVGIMRDVGNALQVIINAHRALEIVRADCVVIATGGYERFAPFPGWTLPNVMTLGAVQKLIRADAIAPSASVLLAGSGPLLWVVADEVLNAGVNLVGIVDSCSPMAYARLLAHAYILPVRLLEALQCMMRIIRARTPIWFRHAITCAYGNGAVQRVRIARLDERGRPVMESSRALACDVLAIGHGLIPNVQLTHASNCIHQWKSYLGGWIPKCSQWLETSVPGIFVAGEVAGVGGAEKAIVEGRIAALGVACKLGIISARQLQNEGIHLLWKRYRLLRWAQVINSTFNIPSGWWEWLPDETIVCRCEDVTIGDIRNTIAEHPCQPISDLNALKLLARVGMGYCQGRTCNPMVSQVVALKCEMTLERITPFQPRLPIEPIALECLVQSNVTAQPSTCAHLDVD